MRRPFLAVLLAVAGMTIAGTLPSLAQGGGAPLNLNNYTDSVSYYIGLEIVRNLRKESILLNMDIFFAGVQDALQRSEARLNPSQRMNVLVNLQAQAQQLEAAGVDSPDKFAEKLYGKVSSNSPSSIKSHNDSVSYCIGFNVGEEVHNQQGGVNTYVLLTAMKTINAKQPLLLTDEDQAILGVRLEMESDFEENVVKKNKAAEDDFLRENAKRSGVVVLPSGLQYEVLTEGKGNKPTINSTVTVKYTGQLIDGTVFDSSQEREGGTVTFELKKVIKGWIEALQMMSEGSKWKLYIPSSLGYGASGAGDKISPYTTLIFEVELIAVEN